MLTVGLFLPDAGTFCCLLPQLVLEDALRCTCIAFIGDVSIMVLISLVYASQ
jgi:hypothetical protein